ncbi:DUF4328 domain-containing protein [Actinokineospora sp. G85]|uniref:DUF4328 domain-containing protein n=1 Tax=Actinokineospora sp. G85 TaxID=3406626 RepID=UPI003C72123C
MHPPQPRLRWVATPPPGSEPPRPLGGPGPYLGPPAYRTPPRWGFPTLAWRWPKAVAGIDEPLLSPVDRLRRRARTASIALWLLAAIAVVATLAEGWRYALLLLSSDGALSRDTVDLSDSLVVTAGFLTLATSLLAVVSTVWWLLTARAVAADVAGYDPPRPDWAVLPSLVAPLVNLVVPGSIVAELEHAILRRDPGERPTPTPLVRWWWATWVLGAVLLTLTIIWRFRTGAQAEADGVVLSALTNATAAAVAILSELIVSRFTALLAPVDITTTRRLRVVSVKGAPETTLRPRPAHAPR